MIYLSSWIYRKKTSVEFLLKKTNDHMLWKHLKCRSLFQFISNSRITLHDDYPYSRVVYIQNHDNVNRKYHQSMYSVQYFMDIFKIPAMLCTWNSQNNIKNSFVFKHTPGFGLNLSEKSVIFLISITIIKQSEFI